MQVDAMLADGKRCKATVHMFPDWSIVAKWLDQEAQLQLQAVMPSTYGDILYLFAATQPCHGVVMPLPPLASELLIYAPLVPLLKRADGFQAITWTSWDALISDLGDVMQASAGDSLTLLGGDDILSNVSDNSSAAESLDESDAEVKSVQHSEASGDATDHDSTFEDDDPSL